MVALTLLKVRMLLDLARLEVDLAGNEDQFVSSIVLRARGQGRLALGSEDLSKATTELGTQVKELYTMVKDISPHFWCKLQNPERGGTCSDKSLLEVDPATISCKVCMLLAGDLQTSYQSWVETPGAVKTMEGIALQDSGSCTARAANQCH